MANQQDLSLWSAWCTLPFSQLPESSPDENHGPVIQQAALHVQVYQGSS